jgi:hypothetical protein
MGAICASSRRDYYAITNMTHDTFLNMQIAPEIKEILDQLRKLEKDPVKI